jgi:hypothetical protein
VEVAACPAEVDHQSSGPACRACSSDASSRFDHPASNESSYSNGNGGACVEVADLDDGARAVRDSKNPTGGHLTFTTAQWAVLSAGVKSGQFD